MKLESRYKRIKKLQTISRDELARLCVVNSSRIPSPVNDGGMRRTWVGIGWVTEGPANGTEKAKVIEP